MAVLVAGGAGYIGSHTVAQLMEAGKEVVVVDSLECGHKGAILTDKFYNCHIEDEAAMNELFEKEDIEAVMHFCAYIEVGESVKNPSKYYNNNVIAGIKLLDMMIKHNVKNFVFSSTAAVYGEPERVPIDEELSKTPANPYGETKWAFENILKWYSQAYDFRYAALRYFNACGAHKDGKIGEDHNPESHLIPLILQVPLGKRENIKIFGEDYPTKDGSCVRDYIHVSDLADAHILALEHLLKGGSCRQYNLGNGVGFTVKEVIEAAREVTGHPIPAVKEERRAGDPAQLIAASAKIKGELGWNPKYTDLKDIIATAWNWHKNHPNGFNE